MRLLIAHPTSFHIDHDAQVAIHKMSKRTLDEPGCYPDLCISSSYMVDMARNDIAQHAIDGGYGWVLMVDSDTVPPETAYVDLLSSGREVCLGYYPQKSDPAMSSLVAESGRRLMMGEVAGDEPFEVEKGGFGCALVNVGVFGRVEYPWFRYVDLEQGVRRSEDHYFCIKCREVGIGVFASPLARCRHVARRVLE